MERARLSKRGMATKGAKTGATKYMWEVFLAPLGNQIEQGWNTLPEHMRVAGFSSISSDIASSGRVRKKREELTAGLLVAAFGWAWTVTEQGDSVPGVSDRIDELEKTVFEEITSGYYFCFEIHVACARKPLM